MILQVRVLARETIVTETIAPKGEQYLVTGVSLLFRKKATNPKKPFRGRNIQRILRTGDRSGAKLFHRGKIGDEEVWRGDQRLSWKVIRDENWFLAGGSIASASAFSYLCFRAPRGKQPSRRRWTWFPSFFDRRINFARSVELFYREKKFLGKGAALTIGDSRLGIVSSLGGARRFLREKLKLNRVRYRRRKLI